MRSGSCADGRECTLNPVELAAAEAQLLQMLHRVREARAEAAAAPAHAASAAPLLFYNTGKSGPSEREVDVWSLLTLKKLNAGSEDASWGRSPAATWMSNALKEEDRFALDRVHWTPPNEWRAIGVVSS